MSQEKRSQAQVVKDFWEIANKANKSEDECWQWSGHISKYGYGVASVGENKQMRAHRAAWVFSKGEIPKGMLVCHKCDNRSCCNPSHLFLGSHLDNRRDCLSKNRNNPQKGERHGMALLTEDQVREIRRRYKFRGGKNSTIGLSKEFGVARCTITAITTRRLWKHIN